MDKHQELGLYKDLYKEVPENSALGDLFDIRKDESALLFIKDFARIDVGGMMKNAQAFEDALRRLSRSQWQDLEQDEETLAALEQEGLGKRIRQIRAITLMIEDDIDGTIAPMPWVNENGAPQARKKRKPFLNIGESLSKAGNFLKERVAAAAPFARKAIKITGRGLFIAADILSRATSQFVVIGFLGLVPRYFISKAKLKKGKELWEAPFNPFLDLKFPVVKYGSGDLRKVYLGRGLLQVLGILVAGFRLSEGPDVSNTPGAVTEIFNKSGQVIGEE